jgi:hypothetical protein
MRLKINVMERECKNLEFWRELNTPIDLLTWLNKTGRDVFLMFSHLLLYFVLIQISIGVVLQAWRERGFPALMRGYSRGVRIPYSTRIGHEYGSDTSWIRIQAVLWFMDTYGYRYAYQTRWGRCGYGPWKENGQTSLPRVSDPVTCPCGLPRTLAKRRRIPDSRAHSDWWMAASSRRGSERHAVSRRRGWVSAVPAPSPSSWPLQQACSRAPQAPAPSKASVDAAGQWAAGGEAVRRHVLLQF